MTLEKNWLRQQLKYKIDNQSNPSSVLQPLATLQV